MLVSRPARLLVLAAATLGLATLGGVPARSTSTGADGRTSPITYKYVPIGEGPSAQGLFGTVLHLETQAIEGWEFCGSLDVVLRDSEYQALRDGKQPGGTTGNEPEKTYRVLVFKASAPK